MADKNNMSFSAKKTCFGDTQVEFYGHVLDKDGIRHAEKHMRPFDNMVPPSDISELRRVLGLFVQHKDQIQEYAMIAAPLHNLTRKGVKWMWRQNHEHMAFELLRAACMRNEVLAAPDYKQQFLVDCDASDDGKGFTIYQLKDPAGPDTCIYIYRSIYTI